MEAWQTGLGAGGGGGAGLWRPPGRECPPARGCTCESLGVVLARLAWARLGLMDRCSGWLPVAFSPCFLGNCRVDTCWEAHPREGFRSPRCPPYPSFLLTFRLAQPRCCRAGLH